jgi:hypothetical protein
MPIGGHRSHIPARLTAFAAWRTGTAKRIRWIVKKYDGIPDWGREVDIPISKIPFRTVDAGAHIAALRQGSV